MTEDDLRPKPAVAPVFGGGLFAAPAPAPSIFSPSASYYGASHFSFGAPVPFSAPKPPPKKKEYGVDYI